MSIDDRMYKDVLARWATGVSIVTTLHQDGQWKGTTVSSFTSVSLNPPLVLICLAQRLYTHALVEASRIFAVNILRHDQIELAKLFAGMYPEITDRFAQAEWSTAVTGSPVLPSSLGWVDCAVTEMIPAGDHTIFIGQVRAGQVAPEGHPLVYHNRQWGVFASLG